MGSGEPTRELAAFAAAVRDPELPPEVVARAKDCVLDWIGAAYAGLGSATDRLTRPLVAELGGRGRATLIGSAAGAPPGPAALYNGMVSAVAELDDVHDLASLHPGIAVVPAALATAEHLRAPGAALLAAVVVGYELSVRVARAAGEAHARLWHPTGTCNTFGAAAAAGRLLGLDAERMAMALGLAGTQAAGLWESINTTAVTAKHLHGGKAAADGVLAAFLAQRGVRGSDTVLEGPRGFLAAAAPGGPADLATLTADLGRPFLITRSFFKKYACCKACIEPIDAIRALVDRHGLREADVSRVVVTLPPENAWLVGNPDPADALAAKFSVAFCLALAAVTGGASVHDFTEARLRDPGVRRWMAKVEVRPDPALPVRARIEVHRPGRPVVAAEPSLTSLTPGEVRAKFADATRLALGARRAARIVDRVAGLEAVADVHELTALLRTRRRTAPA